MTAPENLILSFALNSLKCSDCRSFRFSFPPLLSILSTQVILILQSMATLTTCNPGVGLKFSAPRISYLHLIRDSPSPQSYRLKTGFLDLTEQQKNQNALLSKRYEKSKQPQMTSFVVPNHTTRETTNSFPIRPSSQKRSTRPKKPTSTDFYSFRGMTDLTDREMKQNQMLSNRYNA